ncbi:MAG: hypothetical protein K0U66_08890, partial [Gammaproteobacteria bacterium]|nr:hypothetical protein [Gammaproteobacteria bacterium]
MVKFHTVAKGQKCAPQAFWASVRQAQTSGQNFERHQGLELKEVEQGELADIQDFSFGGEQGLSVLVMVEMSY